MVKTKYIGYGTTITSIVALIGWIFASPYFSIQMEGDKTCAGTFEEPCEWYYNITLKEVNAYYFQNKNHTNLVFVPEVKSSYNCKKDNRFTGKSRLNREQYPCGVGFREFNWSEPLTNKYGYINKFIKNEKQEFKLVVFKNNQDDEIKFGGELFGKDFDPYFLPKYNFIYIKECKLIKNATSHEENWYGICDKMINYTFIDNNTKTNETRQRIINYSCVVGKYIIQEPEINECKNIGVSFRGNNIICPINFKCELINLRYCMMDCNAPPFDTDCNNFVKEENCIVLNKEKGDKIKISNFKKIYVEVI